MSKSIGFVHPEYLNHVCRLNKAIYGLKQAPRAWFFNLSSRLIELGFTRSIFGPNLFIYNHTSILLYFLIYVDDIVITSSSSDIISATVISLKNLFPINNLGPLRFFLSLEINPTVDGLHVSQTKYV